VLGIGAILALIVGVQVAAFASHPEVTLPGSNFEIDTDANLKVNDAAPSIDWASVNETRKADTQSGATDESFGQGTKEDTAVPSVVDGGIPPNKSDLKFFGLYQEGDTSGGFLNLFWSRVQDPTGTTNMDFELNKRQCTPNQTPTADPDCSANGLTPIRSVGDVLVIYDLSNGGTHPTLSIRRWTGSAWGPATLLTDAVDATGSINTSAIADADSDGIGAQSPRTFGEAQIKLSALLGSGTTCNSFGSAYLKSRSSDSFTAALKDFVPPTAVNISNCGSVAITKTDDASPANPLSGAVFEAYKDNAPIGTTRGNEDTATGKKCTTDATGKCTISDLLAGEYWIVETTTPAGHDTAADKHVTVTASTTPVSLTFVDPRQNGAIEVTKYRKLASTPNVENDPHPGVDFTVGGVTKTTDANGKACFDNLSFGNHTVHEAVPAGYHLNGANDKTVAVSQKASCAAGDTGTKASVTFNNTPLTDITVSVNSQVTGGTASKINCTDQTPTPADGTPNDFDDTSETIKDLEPGTYTCTVVVDP